MNWPTPLYLVIALLLVTLNGFFVLAEFALGKVPAGRIEELVRQGGCGRMPQGLRTRRFFLRLVARLRSQPGGTIANRARPLL